MINNEKVYALQNKFPGAGTAGGNYWGQVSYVRTRYFTGMMFFFGEQNDGPCRVVLQNEGRSNVDVDNNIADILLSARECPECDEDHGHKMDCSRNRS